MKNILFVLALLISSVIYAQRSGGRQNQNIPNQANVKPQNFSARNAAGICYYNFDEVSKKLKLKDKDLKNKASRLFKDYNLQVKNISSQNSENLSNLDVAVSSVGSQTRTNPELRKKLRMLIQNTITPVRDSILKKESFLNDNLKDILNEKQLKKWLKYQQNQKNKLKPKNKQTNNRVLKREVRQVRGF